MSADLDRIAQKRGLPVPNALDEKAAEQKAAEHLLGDLGGSPWPGVIP